MDEGKGNDLIAQLRRRLERERSARLQAEGIAERVTRTLYDLNRMKTDFISTVSHEFRTPLTVIIGCARSLDRPEIAADPALRTELLRRIDDQAGRLHGMVEQILESSLLQRGEAEARIEPFDFHALAEDLAAAVRHNDVNVVIDTPTGLPFLVNDPNIVGHILKNLLDNAVKFSKPGGRCTLGARLEGSTFRFWVADEGVGMTPEELEHVFEPFWQADSSASRQFQGVGIGLHVVKLLTGVLGGRITVESELGSGTSFSVALPARLARSTRHTSHEIPTIPSS
jgi:signal transduction histidine kinase